MRMRMPSCYSIKKAISLTWTQDKVLLRTEPPKLGVVDGASLTVWLLDDLCMSIHSFKSASHVKRTHSLSSSRFVMPVLLKSSTSDPIASSCGKAWKPMFGQMVRRTFSSPNAALALKAPPSPTGQFFLIVKWGRVSTEERSAEHLLLWDLSGSWLASLLFSTARTPASACALLRAPPRSPAGKASLLPEAVFVNGDDAFIPLREAATRSRGMAGWSGGEVGSCGSWTEDVAFSLS